MSLPSSLGLVGAVADPYFCSWCRRRLWEIPRQPQGNPLRVLAHGAHLRSDWRLIVQTDAANHECADSLGLDPGLGCVHLPQLAGCCGIATRQAAHAVRLLFYSNMTSPQGSPNGTASKCVSRRLLARTCSAAGLKES